MAGIHQDTSRLTTRERGALYRSSCEFFRDSSDISASINRGSLVFQMSPSTVQRILKKKEGKSVQPGVSSGRKPIPHDSTFKDVKRRYLFENQKQ